MSRDAERTPEPGDWVIFQMASKRCLGIVSHRFLRSAESGEQLLNLMIEIPRPFNAIMRVTESTVVDIVRPETAEGRERLVPFLASDNPDVRSWALRALAGEGGA